MIKMTIIYFRPEDPDAFVKHYMEKHLPLASQMPGLKKLEVGPVLRSPKGPEYFWMAECYFEDMEALKVGFASPAGEAAGQDVASFASGGHFAIVSEVK
jgi:uncharacterized protein (TIGR02118 family)